jgi:hypothetical protein
MADARAQERKAAAWSAKLNDADAAKARAEPIVNRVFLLSPTRMLRALRCVLGKLPYIKRGSDRATPEGAVFAVADFGEFAATEELEREKGIDAFLESVALGTLVQKVAPQLTPEVKVLEDLCVQLQGLEETREFDVSVNAVEELCARRFDTSGFDRGEKSVREGPGLNLMSRSELVAMTSVMTSSGIRAVVKEWEESADHNKTVTSLRKAVSKNSANSRALDQFMALHRRSDDYDATDEVAIVNKACVWLLKGHSARANYLPTRAAAMDCAQKRDEPVRAYFGRKFTLLCEAETMAVDLATSDAVLESRPEWCKLAVQGLLPQLKTVVAQHLFTVSAFVTPPDKKPGYEVDHYTDWEVMSESVEIIAVTARLDPTDKAAVDEIDKVYADKAKGREGWRRGGGEGRAATGGDGARGGSGRDDDAWRPRPTYCFELQYVKGFKDGDGCKLPPLPAKGEPPHCCYHYHARVCPYEARGRCKMQHMLRFNKAAEGARAAKAGKPSAKKKGRKKASYGEESDAESVESETSSLTESMSLQRSEVSRLSKQVAMLGNLVAKQATVIEAKPAAGTRFGKLMETDVESDGSDSL